MRYGMLDHESLTSTFSKRVMTAWENFHANEGSLPDGVRPMVLDSWNRSKTVGIGLNLKKAPIGAKEDKLYLIYERNKQMIASFKRVSAEFDYALAETKNIIVLTDYNGTVININGHGAVIEAGEDIHLVLGSLWHESRIGTNAIGIAIALKHPIQIHALEHYCEGLKTWTCSAAQIRDPIDGKLLGVVNISGSDDTFHTYSLSLATSIARQIEVELSIQDQNNQLNLEEWYSETRLNWRSEEMILLDHKGRIVESSKNAAKAIYDIGLDIDIRAGAPLLTFGNGERKNNYLQNLPLQINPEWLKPYNAEGVWEGGILILPSQKKINYKQINHDARATNGGENSFPEIIGQCKQILMLKKKVNQISGINAPALILGETGSGKELFAKAIHDTSQCAEGPFIPVNCGAFSKDLIVSELFGYEGGAFTGANAKGHIGKFESANGGTLFLDEIGELPYEAQTSLLRVLQDCVIIRIGSNKERKVKVRIIAATNRDLRAEISAGRFREDLYYRLKVIVLELAPLRERNKDIDLLASCFLEQFSVQYGKPIPKICNQLKEAFHIYPWPGNVRELHGVLESMFIFNTSGVFNMSDLPEDISETLPHIIAADEKFGSGQLYDAERKTIQIEILRNSGNLTIAAKNLGIARSTLYKKMEKYGLIADRN